MATGKRGERGAVAVVVAVCLVGMVALTALAMDMSLIFNWRSKDQNAADHAALAAAWAACHGASDDEAKSVALDSASDNGFNNDGTSNTVDVSKQSQGRWQVIVRSTANSIFARIVGVSSLRAGAKAVAQCTGGGGDFVLFAGGLCGEKTIDWSGSTDNTTGNIHSNDGFYMGGSTNVVDGEITYGGFDGNYFVDPANNPEVPTPQYDPEFKDYPVDFPITDFQPGGPKAVAAGTQYYYAGSDKIDMGWLIANGHFDPLTGQLDDGLYYTSGEIDMSAANMHGNVTFVSSSGKVTINGSNQNMDPFDPDDLLLYSTYNPPGCFDTTISVNGSDQSDWTGIVFAPEGMLEMNGSNSFFHGALIAETVRLNGSNLIIESLGPLNDEDVVFLLE